MYLVGYMFSYLHTCGFLSYQLVMSSLWIFWWHEIYSQKQIFHVHNGCAGVRGTVVLLNSLFIGDISSFVIRHRDEPIIFAIKLMTFLTRNSCQFLILNHQTLELSFMIMFSFFQTNLSQTQIHSLKIDLTCFCLPSANVLLPYREKLVLIYEI